MHRAAHTRRALVPIFRLGSLERGSGCGRTWDDCSLARARTHAWRRCDETSLEASHTPPRLPGAGVGVRSPAQSTRSHTTRARVAPHTRRSAPRSRLQLHSGGGGAEPRTVDPDPHTRACIEPLLTRGEPSSLSPPRLLERGSGCGRAWDDCSLARARTHAWRRCDEDEPYRLGSCSGGWRRGAWHPLADPLHARTHGGDVATGALAPATAERNTGDLPLRGAGTLVSCDEWVVIHPWASLLRLRRRTPSTRKPAPCPQVSRPPHGSRTCDGESSRMCERSTDEDSYGPEHSGGAAPAS